MCKNPVSKFEKHILTLRLSSSVANAMLQFEFNWLYIYINEIWLNAVSSVSDRLVNKIVKKKKKMKYDGQLLYTELWIIEENVMGK